MVASCELGEVFSAVVLSCISLPAQALLRFVGIASDWRYLFFGTVWRESLAIYIRTSTNIHLSTWNGQLIDDLTNGVYKTQFFNCKIKGHHSWSVPHVVNIIRLYFC